MTRYDRLACEAEYVRLLAAAGSPEEADEVLRVLARTDLYFLLTVLCRRDDVRHDWVFARIREVEDDPDGHLDLWPRFHFKSSIITFALTIRDILRDPEVRVLILSFNRPTAKTFLKQIKRELETNGQLKRLFPDILWNEPEREAPTWSEDGGLIVKRRGNPKEGTVEAYGLVDGQPVGRHPDVVVYDDVVTRDSVTSPEVIAKVSQAFRESLALGGVKARRRMVGTRWHYADTYEEVIKDRIFAPRLHKPRAADGRPVLLTEAELSKLYRDLGPLVYSAQMELDPKPESEIGFSEKSLRYYRDHNDGAGMNVYILCDPANSKKKDSSYTAMAVIGLGCDGNYYWLDGLRDRLGVSERIDALFALHRRWSRPRRMVRVGWECYGTQQADAQLIRERQDRENYRFPVVELRGRAGKDERIPLLEPAYRDGRWYWPTQMRKVRKATGEVYDLVHELKVEEFLAYPFGRHPDMLDCMSRVMDPEMQVVWPKAEEFFAADVYGDDDGGGGSAWAA